jgi:DNA-binding CsgD family transcriptional regulator
MLEPFYLEITRREPKVQKCEHGVAFLNAAKALYGLNSVSYIAINIPKAGSSYLHCSYSDTCIRQKLTVAPLVTDRLRDIGLLDTQQPVDWTARERLRLELEMKKSELGDVGSSRAFSFNLSPLRGETAIFAAAGPLPDDATMSASLVSEWRALAKYFHSHILRLNGFDTFESLLISARELDCLKWTAAGKTAWEASRILGVSERTVIFHLNAARKKLDCATTTQAVAKAVATQLISI